VTTYQTQMANRADYGLMLKSFLMWIGILTVCLLIVGFPVGILIVGIGSVLAMALDSVLPGVGLVVVAMSFIGVQVFGVILTAAILTLRGTHPKDISWLPWARGEANPKHDAVYAACPLTCDVKN